MADRSAARTEQDFYEVRLGQVRLFAGQAGGLRAVRRTESEFPVFAADGLDVFEFAEKQHAPAGPPKAVILDGRVACHFAPGINSLNSRGKVLKPNFLQHEPLPRWVNLTSIEWKQHRYDWGLLNSYWRASQRSR